MDYSPWMGRVVGHSYSPGYIVLSYAVSIVGAWTAVELLHKRTSARGLYNWYLLLGAATAMGAVAIWSMHYIGNRAITMAGGRPELQISYSPGYTAGSFFLPICVVAIAFYLFSITESVSIVGTVMGGLLTGFAVCGMHYMGQGGISNYQAEYHWAYVLGSAIIAVAAATLALGVFFYFKFAWTNSWWKRLLCACLLAVSVSGMHWLATVGTQYRFVTINVDTRNGLSRHATVIVVLCLAIGCCVTLLAFALIGQRSRNRTADRAQQVVLACATWDPEGRLMVTPEGSLPCRKITNSYLERSFDDVFSIEHPVFCWIFRVSRNWKGVADLIPGMRSHVRKIDQVNSSDAETISNVSDRTKTSVDGIEDYSQAFKELFCIAANDLAAMVQEPLEDVGVLYDEIMSTGTIRRSKKFFGRSAKPNTLSDVEKGRIEVISGRGQLLFVVRRTNKLEAAQLQAAGYRFAAVSNVLDHLSRSMQVTPEELSPRLESMRKYPIAPKTLEPGVHLACFALRPLFQRGFDVLVPTDATNLLPTIALPITELSRWHTDFICRMDDWTVAACLDWLRNASQLSNSEAKEFAKQLFDGIMALGVQIDNPFFQEARLTARPLRSPCRNQTGSHVPGQAMIIAFRIITDIYQSRALNHRLAFTPSRFFLCQQHIYKNSPDHEIFARRIHREFSAVLDRKKSGSVPNHRFSGIGSKHHLPEMLPRVPSVPGTPSPQWKCTLSSSDESPDPNDGDNSSEKNLVEAQSSLAYGGIHVSNEVTIDVSEFRIGDASPDIELKGLGVYSEASVAPVEKETFIDELMALTIGERRQQR